MEHLQSSRRGRRVPAPGLILALAAAWPSGPVAAQAVELDGLRFTAEGQRMERYLGQQALAMKGGTAWLDDVALEDVVIEVDMALPDAFAFAGVRFRAVDDRNHEYYYLRAHQSGRDDATQYMPIFNGLGSWQIHTGPDHAAPLVFQHDRWMHLKLVAVGTRLEVYLDSDQPVHVVPRLVRDPGAGAIGLAASGGNDTRFANLRVRPADAGDLAAAAAAPGPDEDYIGEARRRAREGAALVRRFRVSTPFAEEILGGTPVDPSARPWSRLGWDRLEVEREGIANLARLHGNDEGNTVFAAVTLTSDAARTVPVRLGFSDRARVYLDGTPLFAGADEWRSRDFRFLGTIGLHDTVFLPLRPGENELWIAVSEDFGGWGIMLEVPAIDGLEVTA